MRVLAGSFWRSLSGIGLLLGALFFAASLTPSLIPRSFPLQGVLGGVAFATGYGLGVLGHEVWAYLELREAEGQLRRRMLGSAAAIAAAIVVLALWNAAEWQNSVRAAVNMAPVDSAHPTRVGLIAALIAVLLILLGKLFHLVRRAASRQLDRVVPPRVSHLVGLTLALTLFALVFNGVLFRGFIRMADSSAAAFDQLIEPDVPRPEEPFRTGSAASLVPWQHLGRAGREYVASGPSAAEIAGFLGSAAMEPIRVFVGLNAANEPEERAKLALAELIRVGGFERSVLVIAVPTGTGWMDPAAFDTLEYLHAGDVATVALQYSYLQSWISLLVEPGYGVETGRALFRAIYDHWTGLSEQSRPRLYLQGLSLGAISSEQSVQLHEVLGDPLHGAVWSGPPFRSPLWQTLTAERNPGSPAWLPRYEDGSFVRFTNQENALDIPGAEWGPMRVVYLQYASDPIVFFNPASAFRKPAWMEPPLGPDVSPELRWVPVVTFLQLLLDMAIGLAVPIGHGHLYAHAHYIDAWVEVTEPPDWTPEMIERLKKRFAPAPL